MSGRTCLQEIVLSAYLDGEVSGNELKHVEAHLATCGNCRSAYESMKTDRDLLAEFMPEVDPPEYLKQKLFRKIDASPEIRRHFGIPAWAGMGSLLTLRSRAWTAACASLVVFAVIISVFQYQHRLEDTRLLAEIDRSKAEWVARDYSTNPFNIDAKGAPIQINAENPFKSLLK